jgi:hypothetical protein
VCGKAAKFIESENKAIKGEQWAPAAQLKSTVVCVSLVVCSLSQAAGRNLDIFAGGIKAISGFD